MSIQAEGGSSVNIRPDEIVAYLRSRGWVEQVAGQVASIWQKDGQNQEEMLVPLRAEARDYSFRLSLLIDQLADLERRTPISVREDIARIFFDVSNVRASHRGFDDDSVPLQAGLETFTAAKKMVVASAAATIRRQGQFGRSTPVQARQHAQRVRVGHTRRGSYVVPVFSRAIPALDQIATSSEHLDVEVEESLFDRRVMTTFANALQTLHTMTVERDAEPTESEINGSVSEGVSRDLCLAVSNVTGSELIESLEITFDWSPVSRKPAITETAAYFPSEATPIIKNMAEKLRRVNRPWEEVLFGMITHLEYHDGDTTGKVGIEAVINKKVRTVWVTLPAGDYRQALQSHDRGERVIVRGQLSVPLGGQASMIAASFGRDENLFS